MSYTGARPLPADMCLAIPHGMGNDNDYWVMAECWVHKQKQERQGSLDIGYCVYG
jgi:hypothetical protein